MGYEMLSDELKEQLKNCKTREAAEACLKANQASLSLEEMEKFPAAGFFPAAGPGTTTG